MSLAFFRLSFPLYLLAVPLLGLAPSRASAQARSTASRSGAVSVFGGLQLANPDYGPDRNTGGAIGVNYTRFLHFPVQPSIEARANFNNGPYADERSYLFGVRALLPLGPLRPYADFLVGPGDIHYPRNLSYVGDNSVVYDFGGGVDLDVMGPFALKLDLQGQHWNTGEIHFSPVVGTIGISYRLGLRAHTSRATRMR